MSGIIPVITITAMLAEALRGGISYIPHVASDGNRYACDPETCPRCRADKALSIYTIESSKGAAVDMQRDLDSLLDSREKK